MNKYQEALDRLKDTKCDEINNCKQCSLTSYCGHYQCVKTLQELVDQTKTPTEEEIIKEWEALGYEFCYFGDEIHIKHIEKDKEFIIYLNIMEYCCSEITSCEICFATFQEHQLLTKTFKMLGWEV